MANTVGKQLAQAREQQELSVEDVAHRTRIPANIVRYLENDDYSHFPNLVYAKSFLKMYSRYLEVDASEFLNELGEAAGARGETTYLQGQMTREEIKEFGRGWDFSWDWFPWKTILSVLFFLSVGTAAAWFIYDLYQQNVEKNTNLPENTPVAPAVPPTTPDPELVGEPSEGTEPSEVTDPSENEETESPETESNGSTSVTTAPEVERAPDGGPPEAIPVEPVEGTNDGPPSETGTEADAAEANGPPAAKPVATANGGGVTTPPIEEVRPATVD